MKKKAKKILLTCLSCAFVATMTAACSGGGTSVPPTPDSSFESTADNAAYTINVTSASVKLYEYYGLNVYRDGKKISSEATWVSDTPAVATVDENGVVSAVGMGKANITATINDKLFTCEIEVVAPEIIPTLAMDLHEVYLKKGGTRVLTPVITYKGERLQIIAADITYTSSNPSVEAVKQTDGLCILMGKDACDNVRITVVYRWNDIPLVDTVTVSVGSSDTLTLSQSALDLYSKSIDGLPSEGTLSVTEIRSGGQIASFNPSDITWTIEDTSVATIDANGKVTAKASGQTFACASWTNASGEVQKAYCSVNVHLTLLDITANVVDIDLASADSETKLRFNEYDVELPANETITITDVTDKNNPFTIGYTRTGNVCDLNRADLKAGERTFEVRCGKLLEIDMRVDVVSKIIYTADDFVNWVSTMGKTQETAPDKYGYTAWSYDGYVVLANNIDLTGKTVQTLLNGKQDADMVGFHGTFDGRGYTVTGGTYGLGGMFGTLAKDGKLKNLAIRGAYIYGQNWTSDNEDLFHAVVASHVSGTVENCLFEVTMMKGDNWSMAAPFGREINEATLRNVVVYSMRTQTGGNYIHPYAFLTQKFMANVQTDNMYVFCPSSTYLTDETDDGKWNLDFGGGENKAKELGIVRYPYKAQTTSAMSAALDSKYWYVSQDKAEFSSYATLDVVHDYVLNTGLNDEFTAVANTSDCTVALDGLTGSVQYTIAGTNIQGTVDAANGEVVLRASDLQTLTGGTYSLRLETPKKTNTIRLQLWSGYITTADELLHWQAFTTKETGGTATSYAYGGAVALKGDIDLTGKTVESAVTVKDGAKGFQGLFEGNYYTIKGGVYGMGGLFGTLGNNATVRNVAFVDATVNAKKNQSAWHAVVASNTYGTIENALFDTVIYYNDGWTNASVFGENVSGKMKDVTVYAVRAKTDWSEVRAYRYFGETIGSLQAENVVAYVGAESTDGKHSHVSDGMWALSKPSSLDETGYAQAAQEALSLGITRYPHPGKDMTALPVLVTDVYEMYSGLDDAYERIVNDGFALSLLGVHGEVGFSDGTHSATFTANGKDTVIPGSFLNTLGIGEHTLLLQAKNVTYALQISVCTAILETADDIVYMENYADQTNFSSYENGSTATSYQKYSYDGYFLLGNNIDLTGKEVFTECPVGVNSTKKPAGELGETYGFQGTFDGNGYTLTGGTYGAGGLFGSIGDSGVVKNLQITGASVKRIVYNATDYVMPSSTLAYYCSGTLQNVLVSSTCADVPNGYYHAPALVTILDGATLDGVVIYYGNQWYYPLSLYTYDEITVNEVYIFSDHSCDEADRISLTEKLGEGYSNSQIKRFRYATKVGDTVTFAGTDTDGNEITEDRTLTKTDVRLDEGYFVVENGAQIRFRTK